jgi:hypothetical protein
VPSRIASVFNVVVVAVMMLGVGVQSAGAVVSAPAWSITSVAVPSNFVPGDKETDDAYEVTLTNSGAVPTDKSPIVLKDALPAGLAVKSVELLLRSADGSLDNFAAGNCETETIGEVSTVSCEVNEAIVGPPTPTPEPAHLWPSEDLVMKIHVSVPAGVSGALENLAQVQGGGALSASAQAENQASAAPAPAGFQFFEATLSGADGRPLGHAAAHPYEYTTSFAVNTEAATGSAASAGSSSSLVPAGGDLKDIDVALPPGLIGNPTAAKECTAQQFNTIHNFIPAQGINIEQSECPDASALGLVVIGQLEGVGLAFPTPLYNLVPPKGMPAQLGFQIAGLPIYIDTSLRSQGDYGISAHLQDTSEVKRVTAASVTIWGTPGDPAHDRLRGSCLGAATSGFSHGICPANLAPIRPFLRLPSSCEAPLSTTMSFDTWLHPGIFAAATFGEPAPGGCEQPDFSPSIETKPTSSVADHPTGLRVDLHLPQAEHEDPEGLGEADLRDTSVTLPEGLLVNPSSADGLVGCSEAQIGYQGVKAGRQTFSAEPAECPGASKVGTVEVDTPLIDHPLPGGVYLAQQKENPFGSLLAIYITVYDPISGIVVKLPGKVEPDLVTGQLRTTVQESPQTPFEDLHVDLFEGARAPLRTPATCGAFSTTTSLAPWTSPEGATATPFDSFQITSAPGGGACPGTPAAEPNAPSFEAGTAAPIAGAYSPLVVHLNREDGSQNFSAVNVTLPPGATGKLAGIPECSEVQIAAAQARSHPGEGAAERANPSCPASSAIGTVTVGAGAGPHPFYVTGKAYLAGPYKGAPFSAVFITPAIAGPFDLGVVVVRAGLYVNPSTAQVTTKSDPLPTILDGIPIDVRSVTVTVDRPGFILNPTSCNPLTVTGEEISTLNQTAPLSSRFQVGACQNLKFTPQFTVSTTGKTSKASGASLSVKVAYPAGSIGSQTNLGRVDLQLPKQLPARLSTLQKACTEAQFNTNPAGCPVASMIGTAKAITPLLSSPLTGPAILVSHGGAAFPDVEFLLQGEGVMVVLDGKTQIKKGITYSRFETIPDQPITTFETTFPEGPYSVLATNLPASAKNSLCGQALTLPTTLTAQNGAVINQATKATVTGCAKIKTLTRAQKLALALKACHKKHGAKRKTCEHQARRKYGAAKKKGKK